MHERHTLYRREQAAEWNYRPSKPYALPLGPVVAQSNPSPSYYAKTDAEQINAQQKAYAEALLEQNVALKRRIDELQQKDSTIQNLQGEIERLKKELESRPCSNRRRLMARPLIHHPQNRTISRKSNTLDLPIRARSCFFQDPKPITRRSSSRRCGSMTSCPQNSAPWNDAGLRSFSTLAPLLVVTSH